MMQRRSFLGAMLAGLVAPAIVRTDSLMRPAPLRGMVLWGDGIHDDTVALNDFVRGRPVLRPDGSRLLQQPGGRLYVPAGTYAISSSLVVTNETEMVGSELKASPDMDVPMIYVPEGVRGARITDCNIVGNGKCVGTQWRLSDAAHMRKLAGEA